MKSRMAHWWWYSLCDTFEVNVCKPARFEPNFNFGPLVGLVSAACDFALAARDDAFIWIGAGMRD